MTSLYSTLSLCQVVRRVEDIEEKVKKVEDKVVVPEYDPEVSVIVSNLPVIDEEDPMEYASEVVRRGLSLPEGTCPIVRATRLPQRQNNGDRPNTRPPLMKVEFRSLDEKKTALKAKGNLKNSEYTNVFMRSSKPHVERLLDLNFKTILDLLPNGKDYRVTASGRIMKKDG